MAYFSSNKLEAFFPYLKEYYPRRHLGRGVWRPAGCSVAGLGKASKAPLLPAPLAQCCTSVWARELREEGED